MKKVSLYVPAFNAEKYLARCLDAVLQQSYPVDEVTVVDDGSRDMTAEVAAGFPVKLIKHGSNRGLAASRNTGIRETQNEFVAAVDSDCLVEPKWLERCMEDFDSPRVAAVGGRLIEKSSNDLLGTWRSAHMKHHWGDRKEVNPDFLSGSNVVMRNEALEVVGPYHEKFRTNYEDVDISIRLKKRDLDLIYEPRASAYHIREDSISTLLRTYWGWHHHLYEGRLLRRIPFHLFRSSRMFLGDMVKRRVRCAALDALTFPTSVYFDLRAHARIGSQNSRSVDGLSARSSGRLQGE